MGTLDKLAALLDMTNYIYQIVLYIVLFIGIGFRKSFDEKVAIIFLLLVITVLVETIGLINLIINKRALKWIYDLYLIVEFLFMAKYFSVILVNSRRIINSLSILIIIVLLTFLWLENRNSAFEFYDFALVSFLIVIWSVLFFRQKLKIDLGERPASDPHFWIVLALLLFNSMAFFVMGTIKYVYSINPALASLIYSINHIVNIFYYSLIAYGFYIQWKSTKSSLSS